MQDVLQISINTNDILLLDEYFLEAISSPIMLFNNELWSGDWGGKGATKIADVFVNKKLK